MRYKQELKYRVVDLLNERHKADKKLEGFFILDSPKNGYFSIKIDKNSVPYFSRKAGQYGMIFEKGMCIPVALEDKSAVLQVHIVEETDEI